MHLFINESDCSIDKLLINLCIEYKYVLTQLHCNQQRRKSQFSLAWASWSANLRRKVSKSSLVMNECVSNQKTSKNSSYLQRTIQNSRIPCQFCQLKLC